MKMTVFIEIYDCFLKSYSPSAVILNQFKSLWKVYTFFNKIG